LTQPALLPVHRIEAAVLRRPGRPLQIESLELEGPRDDEVLVRLHASGICHTDIDFCQDWDGPPVVLGHEGAGVVEEAGRRVKGVEPGAPVVLSYQSCGRCRQCRSGRPTACEHFWDLNFASRPSPPTPWPPDATSSRFPVTSR
jgi:aryl-alcohol dehydrogenase